MGNASPEVQRAARYVTTSNEEEGFANAVERVRAGRWAALPAGDAGAPRPARAPACSISTACSPRPPKLHAAAWKQMFDDYLRERAAARGRAASSPSTRSPTTRATSTASCASTARTRSSRRAASSCRTRRSRGAGRAQGRASCSRCSRSSSVETYDGSVRYLRRARDGRPAHGGRLVEQALPARCSPPPGIADLFDARIDGVVAARASTSRASRRPTPTWRPRARSGSTPTRRSCSRMRSPASRPAGRATSATSSASTAWARPPSCAGTAPTWWCPTSAALLEAVMIQHPSFRVEPWSLHETALSLDVLAQTESLFALSNGHIGVRGNLDEGEPHGLPGSYLNGFYELRPLPLGREPVRRSRVEPDAHQRDQRQADPAAGRRRAVRRALRPAARARPRARLPRRHAHADRGVVLAGAPHACA